MAGRDDQEKQLTDLVTGKLRGWLSRVKDAVMKPWVDHKMQPDPNQVYALAPSWHDDVDTILTAIGKIGEVAWNEATDVPSVSRHAFTMAQLAQTENFLVRIPDEVANLIFAHIADTVNGGGDVNAVANSVEDALSWTGSENWPNRAQVIARTETTRAMNAGVQGAAAEMSRVTGRILNKTWVAHHDLQTRTGHRQADNQTVPFHQPFTVEEEPLMFPGDPAGSPANVINCRCSMRIKNEA